MCLKFYAAFSRKTLAFSRSIFSEMMQLSPNAPDAVAGCFATCLGHWAMLTRRANSNRSAWDRGSAGVR
jgi:hypothetical protein